MATETALHIGRKMRQRRMFLHISQEALGLQLRGLTQQAVSKMERGGEVSGSQLLELAQILDVPVAYFFEGLEQPTEMTPKDKRLLGSFTARNTKAA